MSAYEPARTSAPKLIAVSAYYQKGVGRLSGYLFPWVGLYDSGEVIFIQCYRSNIFGGACACTSHWPVVGLWPGQPGYEEAFAMATLPIRDFRVDERPGLYPFMLASNAKQYIKYCKEHVMSQNEIDAKYNFEQMAELSRDHHR